MNSMSWRFMLIDIFLYVFTATSAHFVISLGQTLFHRYLGHRRFGGIFFRNHVHFHHAHYSGDHIASVRHGNNEGNNTPFFLIPTVLVVGLGYLFMRFDLFVVQIEAMSLSFYGHVYLNNKNHLAGSWLNRFSWFKEKHHLLFILRRHADCNF